MGNTSSTKVSDEPQVKFGSIYGKDGKVRPGYYFGTGKILYKGEEIKLNPGETNFQKLNYGYLKTNMRVFYNGKPILVANPVTFSTVKRKDVDKLSKFPEKNKEFKKLNSVLATDFVGNKKRIYYGEHPIHQE
jgi:hypothetical protein